MLPSRGDKNIYYSTGFPIYPYTYTTPNIDISINITIFRSKFDFPHIIIHNYRNYSIII